MASAGDIDGPKSYKLLRDLPLDGNRIQPSSAKNNNITQCKGSWAGNGGYRQESLLALPWGAAAPQSPALF